VEYLEVNKKLPIYNASSFGFIRDGGGTKKAIDTALKLRDEFDWCLKTDIESFFDSIPRDYLKRRIATVLGDHSLVPLLSRVINCEVRIAGDATFKIKRQDIKMGVGIRQGMPLSPILANFVLSRFDREIEKRNIKMVRYADDLILFFKQKADAQRGKDIVVELLGSLDLRIPELEDGSKSQIVDRANPVDFLGLELIFLGKANKFVSRVPGRQIEKIKTQLIADYSLSALVEQNKNFQSALVDLSRSIASYLGIYRSVNNHANFKSEMVGTARTIVRKLFQQVFGENAIKGLSYESKLFLGIGDFDLAEPSEELDL
jgi:hypothetical protein